MLKDIFIKTASAYESDENCLELLWQELVKKYTGKNRHYHNLAHLENMLRLALENRALISDWDTFVFAIFYHDAVYDVLKKDNEEKSAALAEKRLAWIGFPAARIAYCRELIVATKTHLSGAGEAIGLLLDIDLSVLGAPWEQYAAYAAQIRKEYAIYPDVLYKPGRRKVLEQFLEREAIFKTQRLRERLEALARENLCREIALLV